MPLNQYIFKSLSVSAICPYYESLYMSFFRFMQLITAQYCSFHTTDSDHSITTLNSQILLDLSKPNTKTLI